ncbi:MAG: iron-sulfur cluster-binding protein [Anaerolineae bacterium]|nr:iron-sulfur cluster-binding protein [Anaerolineae bacterium]
MEPKSNSFVHSATVAIHDITLQTALDRGTTHALNGRLSAMGELPNAYDLRQQGRGARLRALHSLPDLLEQLEGNLQARGANVLWAVDGQECNDLILEITRRHDVHLVVKGKSMVTEETHLNAALEHAGMQVVETDLGEFIAQMSHETPSHIIMPIVHKTREQVSELFVRELHIQPTDDPAALTAAAREYMRPRFLKADMGITGCNFAIAETGTLCIVTNEGNGRMCSSVPRVHVVTVGIEKVIESVEDFGTLLQILTRSATGQRLSSYVHMISGPAQADDPDGPEYLYVILIDNGRSRIHATKYAEALACIRCGACLNVCPVYRNVGGHAYGWVYAGPIGAVLTPLMVGIHNAAPLPYASSLCGACQEACPVEIRIPDMLLSLRADLVKQGDADPVITWGIKGWELAMRSPQLFEAGGAAASAATHLAASGDDTLHNLPGPLGNWTRNRDFPPFAPKSFHQLWRERKRNNAQ